MSERKSVTHLAVIFTRKGDLLEADFGKEVGHVSSSRDATLFIASTLKKMIGEYFGPLEYDRSELPFIVVANYEQNTVVTKFEHGLTSICANPEVYLAWADYMLDAAMFLEG